MNLEVVKGTAEEFEKAIACPEGEPSMDVYKSYVKDHLAAAEAEGTELVCLPRQEERAGSSHTDQ